MMGYNINSNRVGLLLLDCALIDFGIQWIVCICSILLKTEKIYDLTGSTTFILLAYLSYQWSSAYSLRQKVQTAMVMTWGLRLGLYLFTRIMKEGKDRRFDKARENPALMFLFWTMQGVWVFVTLLPTFVLNFSEKDRPVSNRDYVGWSLWILGFFLEVLADYQKAQFRNSPSNKGRFINTGLWRFSRHPNYLGEIMLWFGLYISASSVMKGYQFLTVLCPIFDMFLITRISGIPLLEQHGMKIWGHDPSYRDYVHDTAILIPFIW
ncbi:uncharacterized protein LOC143246421 [Tachypleus tridentatus]|uniref:uncharacterized protein LOC143246421 n=1 Tax=Tachypleus tridentatus TaxID=6853 RepID=UPI003FD5324B